MLVEAAKLAPRQYHELALIHEKEKQRGNRNRATLAVARKMVAYLLAVDRRKQEFVPAEEFGRHGSGLKTFLTRRKKYRITQCAGCQVLQVADWAKEVKLPRLPSDCFGTGREHKLNLL